MALSTAPKCPVEQNSATKGARLVITVTGTVFQLDTAHTSYLFEARDGLLQQLYYGPRIKTHDVEPLREKTAAGYGSEVVYKAAAKPLSLDSRPLEFSPKNKGDYRLSAFSARTQAGFPADFVYEGFRVEEALPAPEGLPAPHGADGCLAVTLKTADGLEVELLYGVFEQADVIAAACALSMAPARRCSCCAP